MKLFGQYLRGLREQNEIPQRKVAEALDIDVSVLSRIESGNRLPKKNIELMLGRLSKLFGRPEQELRDQYISDEIALRLVQFDNVESIINQAKKKVDYLRDKKTIQSTIDFNE